MKVLGRGEEGEMTVLEVTFVSYSGSEPVEYEYGNTIEKATGLYMLDMAGNGWLVPKLSRVDCAQVVERLFRDGSVSLMDFMTDYIYPAS